MSSMISVYKLHRCSPRVFHARPNNLSRAFLRRNLRWDTRLSHPPRHIMEARRELNFMILSILNIPTQSEIPNTRLSHPPRHPKFFKISSFEMFKISN
jgi:hypothetical protein